MFGDASVKPLGRREVLLAVLIAIVLAAIPMRAGLFNTDKVQFGVESAMYQEPWATANAKAGLTLEQPLNQGLSDQSNALYPFYRWVSRSWIEGDAPTWNPLIYVGAPALGNPQTGVLDPQVLLLVFFDWIGGQRAFDWAFSLLGFLRFFAAGLGAYFLGRRLGLGTLGAGLAGLTFGFSGYLVLWLNSPLGHVPPLFPWLLFFLEGLRTTGPGQASAWPRRRAFLGASLCMALAIYAGHPETSFFVGFGAGLWALAIWLRERRAGYLGLGSLALGSLLAAPVLVPFYKYLMVSSAHEIRSVAVNDLSVDFAAVAMCGFFLVVLFFVQRLLTSKPPGDPATEEEDAPERSKLGGAVGATVGLGALGLLTCGSVLWLLGRGMRESALLTWLPDLWGTPGRGAGYTGPGTAILEGASGFVLTASLIGALASFFAFGMQQGEAADDGRGLRMRRLILVLGFGSLALVVGAPGLLDLYRHVPLVGLGDTVRFAVVSSLMLGLLAGEGLERAGLKARIGACVLVAGCFAATVLVGSPPPEPDSAPGTDLALVQATVSPTAGLVHMLVEPGSDLGIGTEKLEGWLPPGLDVASMNLRLERFLADGSRLEGGRQIVPCELHVEATKIGLQAMEAKGELAPEGASFFRVSYLQTGRLDEGWWGLFLDFDIPGMASIAGPAATHSLGLRRLFRPQTPGTWTLVLVLGSAGLFLLGRRSAVLLLPLAAAQGLLFSAGQNPAYDRAAVFPETETERILGAGLGPYRYFAEPGVMPPNTGMMRGLACLDGYDALDPLSYVRTRPYAMKPGAHPLLAWNARGADLSSPAFRMLGVKYLVLAAPLEPAQLADWELVASPRPTAGLPYAETFLYEARALWPRAFCVTEALLPEEIQPQLATWDPRETAILLEPWSTANPAQSMTASEPVGSNRRVTCTVELDGEALFVLTDQYFAGAVFRVNGVAHDPIPVNGLFSGVVLQAGKHEVVLERPLFW
ncbi:MAG: hypothetical protein ACJAZ8_001351 [Planctomycetota bacterium]|jgi:hypothetical protein